MSRLDGVLKRVRGKVLQRSEGRTTQVEGTANAKHLRWEYAIFVEGLAKMPVAGSEFVRRRMTEDELGDSPWVRTAAVTEAPLAFFLNERRNHRKVLSRRTT